MAQIPPIDDAYINEIIKSNGPYNPALLKTQGLKMRELIKLLRDRMEQGDTGVVHTTGDESISGTKTFTLIKVEGFSVNNLANPSLNTVISPITGVQTKLLNITEGAFGVQLAASVLAASRSQLLQDKDGVIALTSDLSAFATSSELNTELALKIDNTARGVPGGVSTLDGGGKIPTSQLPDSISGALTYQGTWNATTNTPALVDPPASSTKGNYYVTNIAGTQFGIAFAVGDWILSNGTAWEKVDNTDAVATVFGRLGNVLANEGDYSAFYPLLSGSYANPSWITSLAYDKITGTPNLSGKANLAGGNVFTGNQSIVGGNLISNGNFIAAGNSEFGAQSMWTNGATIRMNNSSNSQFVQLYAFNLASSYTAILPNKVGTQTFAMISDIPSLSGNELLANKQSVLTADGTGTKYPTVTAVNTGLSLKANLSGGNSFTGYQSIYGATGGLRVSESFLSYPEIRLGPGFLVASNDANHYMQLTYNNIAFAKAGFSNTVLAGPVAPTVPGTYQLPNTPGTLATTAFVQNAILSNIFSISSYTSSSTLPTNTLEHTAIVNTSSITITLPDAALWIGRKYIIKGNSNTTTYTVASNTPSQIEIQSSFVSSFTDAGSGSIAKVYIFQSDGSKWRFISSSVTSF
jgi:hypothetical protein